MANTTPPRAADLTLMIVPPLPSTSISATVISQSRHVLVGSPVYAWAPGFRTIQPLAAARGFRNRRATTETCSPMRPLKKSASGRRSLPPDRGDLAWVFRPPARSYAPWARSAAPIGWRLTRTAVQTAWDADFRAPR